MKSSSELVKGVAIGVVSGLFASFAMNQFQKAWTAIGTSKPAPGAKVDKEEEPVTVKCADRICMAVSGKSIPKRFRPLAGNAVHYGLGAGLGGAYGGGAHFAPAITGGGGTAYSAAVWLGLDEGMLPALGLGKKWTQVPAATHLYGLASHLVFGAAMEGARRFLRRVWR